MKRLILLLAIIWLVIPAQAQLAIKGGLACRKDYPTQRVVTGQYYRDFMAISSDVYIPHCKEDNLSVSARAGINLGGEWIRFVADAIGICENKQFRAGYGVELNLMFLGPLGLFARWSETYAVFGGKTCSSVWWNDGRKEVSFGVQISI